MKHGGRSYRTTLIQKPFKRPARCGFSAPVRASAPAVMKLSKPLKNDHNLSKTIILCSPSQLPMHFRALNFAGSHLI